MRGKMKQFRYTIIAFSLHFDKYVSSYLNDNFVILASDQTVPDNIYWLVFTKAIYISNDTL